MSLGEILILWISGYITVRFLGVWYTTIVTAWPSDRARFSKITFAFLPAAALMIIAYTLKESASFDVEGIYILLYILFGIAWIGLGMRCIFTCFDLSWQDDALHGSNAAAAAALTGGFLGMTLIYSGANIGDGPGWWCVLFAGGLGTAAWFLAGYLLHLLSDVFERITIERNIGCGIRIGFYFAASGILLGRASAGDWTSFSQTVVEFMDGWPLLLLLILVILVERYYIYKEKKGHNGAISGSVFWGLLYLGIAVITVLWILQPPAENPVYVSAAGLCNYEEFLF